LHSCTRTADEACQGNPRPNRLTLPAQRSPNESESQLFADA
jgi:hypothetical protein